MEGNFEDLFINIWGSHRALDHCTSVSRVLCCRWTQWCWFAGSVPHPAECIYSRNARWPHPHQPSLPTWAPNPCPASPRAFTWALKQLWASPGDLELRVQGILIKQVRGSRATRGNGRCLAPFGRTAGQGLSIKNRQLSLDLDASLLKLTLRPLALSAPGATAAPQEDQTVLLPCLARCSHPREPAVSSQLPQVPRCP